MSDKSEHSDEEAFLTLEIRQFHNLGLQREIEEYMKPYSVEMLIRDSDDVCMVAVMIMRKLFGIEGGEEFSL
jgi:hypothetical protein